MRIRPYILAGGKSSRMGKDKAMLLLGGKTLLRRAVDTLRAVPSLGDSSGKVTVTVAGERTELEGTDRVITDRYPGCGPLGGMESALRDLGDKGDSDWAFFLPVDMPFLPFGLIEALLNEWMEAGRLGARACYVMVDGTAQPLVSMVHKSLHPFMVEALTAGQFKVTPVLQSATDALASFSTDSIGYRHLMLHTTTVCLDGQMPAVAGWIATEDKERLKRLWFSNLNNEEDFREAETFVSSPG